MAVLLATLSLSGRLAIGDETMKSDSLVLVKDGVPNCTIVLGRKPLTTVCWAAGELQTHIEKITGATVPVLREPAEGTIANGGVLIYIGESRGVNERGFKSGDCARQEFLVKTFPDAIVLFGHDEGDRLAETDELKLNVMPADIWGERGSLNATYEFLEKGCDVRWFAPGDLGLSLTPRKTLEVAALDIKRKPSFEDRKAPFGIQYKQWGELSDSGYAGADQTRLLNMRLKMGGEGRVMGHTFEGFFERFRSKSAEHPEVFEGEHRDYFSQKNDIARQMCFTSTGLLAQVVKDAREFFDGKGLKYRSEGGSDWYGIGPCDTMDWCTCSNCAALLQTPDPKLGFANRTASKLVWTFAAKVAREIAKTHPGKNIACFAYADYTEPPEGVDLPENMYVVPCMWTRSWIPDGGENLRQYRDWAKRFPGHVMSMWIYPCFPQETSGSQGFYCFPCFEAHEMSRNFKEFASDGMKGFMVCGGFEPTEYWLYGKLTDDANQDVDALLDEYFTRYYGAAAEPMKKLYLEMEKTYWTASNYPNGKQDSSEMVAWDYLGTQERMDAWQPLMDEAVAKAQTDMEKKRVSIFQKDLWNYMVRGRLTWVQKKKYQKDVDAAKAALPPSFNVVRVPEVADGDPNKVDWTGVKSVVINRNIAGYPLETRHADVKMAHDGKTLYLHIDDYCDTTTLNDYGCDWFGDHWEFFFSAQRNLKAGQDLAARDRGEWGPYRQLGITSSGRLPRWTSNEPDYKAWRAANLQLKTDKKPDNWVIQLSIPLDQYSEAKPIKPGESIYINMFRCSRLEVGDTLNLSPTFNAGAFHNIPRMAELKLAE